MKSAEGIQDKFDEARLAYGGDEDQSINGMGAEALWRDMGMDPDAAREFAHAYATGAISVLDEAQDCDECGAPSAALMENALYVALNHGLLIAAALTNRIPPEATEVANASE